MPHTNGRTGRQSIERLILLLGMVVAGFLPVACDRSPTEPDLQGIWESVTPELAAELSPSGEFVLHAPDVATSSVVTAERASELAIAHIATFGRFHREAWSEQHGAPIEIESLRPDSRVYYAESPYGPLPSDAHPSSKKIFGPYYFVHFLAGDAVALSVAVSGYNTDVGIVNGLIDLPVYFGSEFFGVAIPRGVDEHAPMSPELAARVVASATARKVSEVPVLVLAPHPYAPQHARWRVPVDRPVEVVVVATGRALTATEIYVGHRKLLYVEAPVQPVELTIEYFLKSPGSPEASTTIAVRQGVPLVYREVGIVGKEG